MPFTPTKQARTHTSARQRGKLGLDALHLQSGSNYARIDPSLLNGRDNPPPVTDGKCSMVGTWDVPSAPDAPAASFSFDEVGNFVGALLGSELCASHTMYGTYSLTPGLFELTTNIGMGGCAWWFGAGYTATFDGNCAHLMIRPMWDGCTGGRRYFDATYFDNYTTTLTKHP
ncbi:MAG TPA: hypothetical protein VF881_06360 [Polyangiaceae bacterium]